MSLTSTTSKSNQQAAALKSAQAAADKADAPGMLQGLCDAMIFEGYAATFAQRFPEIKEDVSDIIGAATDDLYDRVKNGKQVNRVESYLWKMVNNRMAARSEEKLAQSGVDVETLGYHEKGHTLDERVAADNKKDEALTIALSLLPQLGQTNVQAVMQYVLEAIRNGADHIDHGEVAEALGLSRDVAKQSLHRGFQRLTRVAREQNLVDSSFTFPLSEEVDYLVNIEDDFE